MNNQLPCEPSDMDNTQPRQAKPDRRGIAQIYTRLKGILQVFIWICQHDSENNHTTSSLCNPSSADHSRKRDSDVDSCPYGTYCRYGKCTTEIQYGGSCFSALPCKSYLTCLNGICSCASGSYADTLNARCLPKIQYGGSCSSAAPCKSYLTCLNGICDCASGSYADTLNERCLPKLQYGGSCSSAVQCKSYLTCLNGICDCASGSYADTLNERCLPKLQYGGSCSSAVQCKSYLTCLNGICGCASGSYADTLNERCLPKLQYGGSCSSAVQCKSYLTCLNGICDCAVEVMQILLMKDAFQSYLTCLNGICDCASGSYADTFNERCLPKLSYFSPCSTSQQCKDSLTCLNGVCNCTNAQFYHPTQAKCLALSSHLSDCYNVTPKACETNLLCTDEINSTLRCLCAPDMYYSGGSCRPITDLQITLTKKHARNLNMSWKNDDQSVNVTFKIMWSAVKNISDSGELTTDKGQFVVTGLTPGREYNFTVQSVLAKTELYNERTTSVHHVFQTDPSVPGQVNNVTSQLDGPPYVMRFSPSEGDVAYYKVTMTYASLSLTFKVDTPEVTYDGLHPGTVYVYSIVAYNSDGDFSDATVGTFKTGLDSTATTTETENRAALIAGITAGIAVALVAVIIIAVYLIWKKRHVNQDKALTTEQPNHSPTTGKQDKHVSGGLQVTRGVNSYDSIEVTSSPRYCNVEKIQTDNGNYYTILEGQPLKQEETNDYKNHHMKPTTHNVSNPLYENYVLPPEHPA
ncbi:hypothetical protein Btru_029264 [Bulinus truncatus]|nr:hypothetical protein Btru_029264 [Bulinus truncatus]